MDGLLPAWFTRLHPRFRTPINSILFVGAIILAFSLAGQIGVGLQEAFQLLENTAGILYGFTYLSLFAIPLFAARRLPGRPPLWLRGVALSGMAVTLLYCALSIFPIIDVPSWTCSRRRSSPCSCSRSWSASPSTTSAGAARPACRRPRARTSRRTDLVHESCGPRSSSPFARANGRLPRPSGNCQLPARSSGLRVVVASDREPCAWHAGCLVRDARRIGTARGGLPRVRRKRHKGEPT